MPTSPGSTFDAQSAQISREDPTELLLRGKCCLIFIRAIVSRKKSRTSQKQPHATPFESGRSLLRLTTSHAQTQDTFSDGCAFTQQPSAVESPATGGAARRLCIPPFASAVGCVGRCTPANREHHRAVCRARKGSLETLRPRPGTRLLLRRTADASYRVVVLQCLTDTFFHRNEPSNGDSTHLL